MDNFSPLTVVGSKTKADVFAKSIDEITLDQIREVCSEPSFSTSRIAVMPDCHAGKGCVIGFTCITKDSVVPNLVGVDISCTVSAHEIPDTDIDLDALDAFIHQNIPSGFHINPKPVFDKDANTSLVEDIKVVLAHIGKSSNLEYVLSSLGSLGGGNHFISIEKSDKHAYLLIHSGSRNFGKLVCEYYQDLALSEAKLNKVSNYSALLEQISPQQREAFIQEHKGQMSISKTLPILTGDSLVEYLYSVGVCSRFAELSHQTMADRIFQNMGWGRPLSRIVTNHNYLARIDQNGVTYDPSLSDKSDLPFIIRKGSVDASKDKVFLVPLNMRDGTLVCKGLGNPKWNFSAPHGAGRVLSRSKALKTLSLDSFKESMQGIYTSCVNETTLDEAPDVYKNHQDIIDCIQGNTAEVIDTLRPVYNFKAS